MAEGSCDKGQFIHFTSSFVAWPRKRKGESSLRQLSSKKGRVWKHPENWKSLAGALEFRSHDWPPQKKEMSLCLDIFLKRNATKSTQHIHPCRLTRNVIMEVWKIIFLFKWVICRFRPLIFQGVLKKTWSSTPTSVLCRQLPMPGQSSPSASSIPFDGLKLKSASSWLCAAAVIYACTDYGRN